MIIFPAPRPPVDIEELPQRAFDGRVIQAEGDEAAFLVHRVAEAEGAGFELRPVGAECVGGHAEDEYAGMFEPFFDLRWDAVAGLEYPFVEPDA